MLLKSSEPFVRFGKITFLFRMLESVAEPGRLSPPPPLMGFLKDIFFSDTKMY
jgi:hypothetical protein